MEAGRARRAARPERRRQVDARQDRRRARPARAADRRGLRRAGRLARARGRRSGTSPSSSASPAGTRADEVLELHQRLAGSHGGAAERARAARAGRAHRRARPARRRRCRRGCSSGSGSRRRSSASRALLLLDEPTSALDPVGRRTVGSCSRSCARGASRVLLNSHLLSEIELVCDRVAILFDGRGRRGGDAGGALAPARGRGRHRRGRRGWSRARRAKTRRGSSPRRSRRAAGLRRPRPRVDARGRLPRSGGRRDRLSSVAVIVRLRAARGAAAEGLRGRPAADRRLPRVSSGSAHALVVRRTARRDHAAERRARRHSDVRRRASCSGWRCSRRSSSASCSRSS